MTSSGEKVGQHASTIDAILPRIYRDFEEASQLLAMLNYINDTADFRRHFDNTYEANGLNVIYHSILNSLISVLSRMYDPFDLRNRRQSNRASLRHVMTLLEDKDVISAFVERARTWTPSLMAFEEQNVRTALKSIQKARVRFRRFTTGDDGKKRLTQLKKYRDHFIGHSLFDTSTEINLLYRYIGETYTDTGNILQPLRLGLAGENWDYTDTLGVNESMASRFWSALATGMAARKAETESLRKK